MSAMPVINKIDSLTEAFCKLTTSKDCEKLSKDFVGELCTSHLNQHDAQSLEALISLKDLCIEQKSYTDALLKEEKIRYSYLFTCFRHLTTASSNIDYLRYLLKGTKIEQVLKNYYCIETINDELVEYIEEISKKYFLQLPLFEDVENEMATYHDPIPIQKKMRHEWLLSRCKSIKKRTIIGYVNSNGKLKNFLCDPQPESKGVRVISLNQRSVATAGLGDGAFKVVTIAKRYLIECDPTTHSILTIDRRSKFALAIPSPKNPFIFTPTNDWKAFHHCIRAENVEKKYPDLSFTGIENPPLFQSSKYYVTERYESTVYPFFNNTSSKILEEEAPVARLRDQYFLDLLWGLRNMYQHKFLHLDIKFLNTGVANGKAFHTDVDTGIFVKRQSAKKIKQRLICRGAGGRPCLIGSRYYIYPSDFEATIEEWSPISFEETHKRRDVVAMACILLELSIGCDAFDQLVYDPEMLKNPRCHAILMHKDSFGFYEYDLGRDLVPLVKSMLDKDWNKRPNGQEAYDAFKKIFKDRHGALPSHHNF